MLFNSLDFAIFLPLVYSIYWFILGKNRKGQNILLLIASYIFYGWWDWRFLGLILFSTVVDYLIGIGLDGEDRQPRRKMLLLVSVLVNLGFLAYFKYFNFFLENINGLFSFMGTDISIRSLEIVLPVGISFYTFQTLSYSIDVYRKNLEPTKDFLVYSAYVSFFPQLVAGPIERATRLLPQFLKDRKFNYLNIVDGLRQILWGLFKKVVIADSCAVYANLIFDNASSYSGSTLFLGAIFFAFQIYGDFSGYSDIAIGVAKLFGFDLMRNFAFPYFSRDVAEFWRRWHISLTSWFRDYLYIPLGGSRGGIWKTIRNIFIIFLISGIWHGANWTFISWGLINAVYFLPLMLMNRNRENLATVAEGKIIPSLKELLQMALTFSLTVFAWIFFRAKDLHQLALILTEVLSPSFFTIPYFFGRIKALYTILWVVVFIFLEWIGREKEYAIQDLGKEWKPVYRWLLYYGLVYVILIFGGPEQQFIYFQF